MSVARTDAAAIAKPSSAGTKPEQNVDRVEVFTWILEYHTRCHLPRKIAKKDRVWLLMSNAEK
jgi:hypothetical protein